MLRQLIIIIISCVIAYTFGPKNIFEIRIQIFSIKFSFFLYFSIAVEQ